MGVLRWPHMRDILTTPIVILPPHPRLWALFFLDVCKSGFTSPTVVSCYALINVTFFNMTHYL